MPRSTKKSLLFGLLVIGLSSLVLFARVFQFYFTPYQPGSQVKRIVQVFKGESPQEISRTLKLVEVISNDREFLMSGKVFHQWTKVKAGEYEVSSALSPSEIFGILVSGVSITHPITVKEGQNIYEISDDIALKGLSPPGTFLALAKNQTFIHSLPYFKNWAPPTLEGYFFPDTYFFNRTQTDVDMAKQMVKHFFDAWGTREEARAKALGLSQHEVLTLASIIEKETGAPEERPIISSVFHNRLKKGIRLQSDPTTIYGMWEHYRGKIHKADLSEKNAYNTYMLTGLPAGPIGNPGKESIQAALNPQATDYFFFVSHNDGTHQFSKTYQEHVRAVRKFQLDPAARQGKSWRDRLRKPARKGSS